MKMTQAGIQPADQLVDYYIVNNAKYEGVKFDDRVRQQVKDHHFRPKKAEDFFVSQGLEKSWSEILKYWNDKAKNEQNVGAAADGAAQPPKGAPTAPKAAPKAGKE